MLFRSPHACFLFRYIGGALEPFNKSTRILDFIVVEGEEQLDACNVGPKETIGVVSCRYKDSIISWSWDVAPLPKRGHLYLLAVHSACPGDIAGSEKCGNC